MKPTDANWEEFCMECEILSEFTSEVLAYFSRYFLENNIDIEDKINPIVVMNNKLCRLKAKLYTDEVKTIQDLKIIEENFLFAKSVLNEIYINMVA